MQRQNARTARFRMGTVGNFIYILSKSEAPNVRMTGRVNYFQPSFQSIKLRNTSRSYDGILFGMET